MGINIRWSSPKSAGWTISESGSAFAHVRVPSRSMAPELTSLDIRV